jgi:photosystem II stability/assembly factor-like uncharacterized protein
MIWKRSFIYLCVLVCSSNLLAQSLQQKLSGLERIDEIMDVVNDHYEKLRTGELERAGEVPIKHWVRWAYELSSKTDGEGRLVDVQSKMAQALKEYDINARSSTGNWTFIGPSSISHPQGSAVGIGRADRIAFHPTDVNTFYVASPSGGLLKTTNGGASYAVLTENLPSTGVSGIIVDSSNPNLLMILTGDGDSNNGGFVGGSGFWRRHVGVYVSGDGGINWFPAGQFPGIVPVQAGFQLAQDPNNPNIVLAATDMGIFRSTNFGGSWTRTQSGLTYELKFRPGDSNIAYATQTGRFFRSTDGGQSWTRITNFDIGLPTGRVALSVNPGSVNRVYLVCGTSNDTQGTFSGMFLSTDAGVTFTRTTNTPNIIANGCDGLGGGSQAFYDLAIVADPSDPDALLSGAISTWRTENDGTDWENVSAGRCTDFTNSTGFVHADVHDLEVNPLNGSVYLCSDGGVVRSDDFGDSWINLSNGLATSQIYQMAGTGVNTNHLIIGLQDNGIKQRNTNTTVWTHAAGADGFDAAYIVSSSELGYLSRNRSVELFSNNGLTLDDRSPPGIPSTGGSGFFPRVQVHNQELGFVLVGSVNIFKSTDFGNNWTNEGAAGNWDIERSPSNPDRFYAAGSTSGTFGTNGTMYRSDDEGDTWTVLTGNTGFPTVQQRITDIEVNPAGSNNVWITLGGFSDGQKVFTSFSSGGSWTNMSGSLPNVPVNAIQMDGNGNIYIGTDIGVFYRGSGMSDWVPFWNQMPIVPVSDLVLYSTYGFIRASTFGRGVWQSDVYSNCLSSISVTSNVSGNRYFEASNSINASSIIFGAANTRVSMKAGDHIELKQGFSVGAGNKFRAYLRPCGIADEN